MNRLVILMYHMLCEPRTEKEKRFACPPARFREHMTALRQEGCHFVSMRQVETFIKGEANLPDKAVAITFDDGFQDNYENGLPLFTALSVPATIFLITGHVGRTNAWMNQDEDKQRPMMNWPQIVEMADAGIEFGGHTVSHPRLPELEDRAMREEISDCKTVLEERLGRGVRYFAYPYGLFNDAAADAVREAGYALACSTRSGFNRAHCDQYSLRRIEVHGTDPVWKLKQKITFGTNEAGVLQPLRYYWRRLRSSMVSG